MRIWVSKYALSKGVYEIDADVQFGSSYARDPAAPYTMLRIGRDCFHSKMEAVHKAEALRAKKIDSLEKQITRLRKFRF